MKADQQRHDEIAHDRQRKLSWLLLLSNVAIAATAVVLASVYDWDAEISRHELIILTALLACSWLALLVAAGAIGSFVSLLSALAPEPGPSATGVDASFLSRYRMYFYYTGVVVNLAAAGYFTELTGGLGESPFVPIFVAFVLIGPQLSRFKTQSRNLLCAGLAASIAMLLLEPAIAKPATAAPTQLTIAAVLLAVIVGGVLTYYERPHNHNVARHVHPPSRVRIYCDGRGNWRFAFYRKSHRQDPILLGAGGMGPSLTQGAFPDGLKERFEDYVSAMTAADWGRPRLEWPEKCTRSFAISLTYELEEHA